MIPYGFVKEVDMTMEQAEERVRGALEQEKFGVLTRIDMAAKLREKAGAEMEDYIILGACNPPNAYKAVQAEPNIGLLLPCNVIIYRSSGKTMVGVVKPSSAMSMVENESLAAVAGEVEKQLERVFDAI
ncbi:MAG: DUF302 domain-containing protein [Chitinivibrionales bacterium]|nr:DUF302 domain-containing protein [Chitinivibrionales bacterium]